jgi:hypothetical protein
MPASDSGDGVYESEGSLEAKRLLDAGHIDRKMYDMLVAQDSKYHEHAEKKNQQEAELADLGPGAKYARELIHVGTLDERHLAALVSADKRYHKKEERREHFFSSLIMGVDYYIWKPPHVSCIERRLPANAMREMVQRVSEELDNINLLEISCKLPLPMTKADPTLWQRRTRGKSGARSTDSDSGAAAAATPIITLNGAERQHSTSNTTRRRYSQIKKKHVCIAEPMVQVEASVLIEDYCSTAGSDRVTSVKGLFCHVETDTVGGCSGWNTTLRIEVRLVLTPPDPSVDTPSCRRAVPPAFVLEV